MPLFTTPLIYYLDQTLSHAHYKAP